MIDGRATPVDRSCLDLVSLETMYNYDPNFGLQSDWTPAAGSLGNAAVTNGGVACSWLQQTSGDTIDISVAHPSAADLAELKTDASAGTPTGSAGFFSSADGAGTIQLFDGTYWVVATSTYFLTPEDAQPLLASVQSALG